MWLVESTVREQLAQAQARGEPQGTPLAANANISVSGRAATIEIKGVLTRKPSILAQLFGGGNTTYASIIESLVKANDDSNIDAITLDIDSPGGTVDGLFDTIAAMQATTKPITALVTGSAASAAYALAAQAGDIVAANRSVRVGSIGVAKEIQIRKDVQVITSSEAPKKRPDASTEEGREVIREELDAMHELFVESIALGRSTTMDAVNSTFGQGAMVLADQAERIGMIDRIQSQNTVEGMTAMNLETLRAQHPDLCLQIADEAVATERDRSQEHLIMGKECGDLETALAAVADGSKMTGALRAKYLTAGINAADIRARANDNILAGGADTVDNKTDEEADSSKVLHMMADICGVELHA